MLRSREMKASLLAVFVMGLLNASMFAAHDGLHRDSPKFTPTIDGTVSAGEIAGQLAIPIKGIVAAPTAPDVLTGTAYLSWDDDNVNFSAVVSDNTPNYDAFGGNEGIFSTQDVVQVFFNPENDHSGFDIFYDFVADTAGSGGPDAFRRRPAGSGDEFTMAEYNDLINKTNGGVDGSTDPNGYHVEVALPWSVAAHDATTGNTYVPQPGDEHGIGFFLISENSTGLNGFLSTAGFTASTLNTMVLVAPPVSDFTDFDNSGFWDLPDLNLVLFNWQQNEVDLPTAWMNQRPGTVGLESLNMVLFNWQQASSLAVVPEPAAGLGASLGLLVAVFCLNRRRRR